jgi:predicted nuclease of predicted toxin-antitoxin system
MLRFLVDEDMPKSSAKLLTELGYDAAHVKECGLTGQPDSQIFEFAQEKELIIITRDLGFSNLIDYPLGTHCGIVVFRVPNFFTSANINSVLLNFIRDVNVSEIKNSLTIVSPDHYRIRSRFEK